MQKCEKCNLTIHADFVGHHKCGYANCPVCKNAITNSEYWPHIRSHPGHENDAPPQRKAFDGDRRHGTGSNTYRRHAVEPQQHRT